MQISSEITFENAELESEIAKEELSLWIEGVLGELSLKGSYCELNLVTSETIREINKEHRGKDYATDVLSFSQVEGEEISGNCFLGDIVVSIPYAKEQAEQYGHPLLSEVKYLILHGILHLLGYDHTEEENGEMSKMEKDIFYKLTGEIIE